MSYELLDFNPNEPLNQGDVIKGVHVLPKSPGISSDHVQTVEGSVIVLNADCELDKVSKHSGSAVVALVTRLARLDSGDQGHVRKNRILHYFYLPAQGIVPVECYIDFRSLTQVDMHALIDARRDGRYLCTLAGDLKKAALDRLVKYFIR